MRSGALCVSLTPESLDDVFSADVAGVDCIEVRLDYLKEPQQAQTRRWDRLPVPVIVTCRGKQRGGLFDGSIEEEIRILESAARNGARFVDIDYRFARPFPPAEVIASYHNFDETPADLDLVLERACASGGVAKAAVQVRTWADNRKLFDLLSRPWPKPVILAGMGEIGQITRIVGPSRGSFLTYAADSRARTRSSAPGQLTVREMLDVYRFRQIRASTRLVGILGMPVGHSFSPAIHNRAFEASKLDFVYLKLPAPDLQDFFENARAIGICGFSVTIPHKVAVMRHLDAITPAASAVGAVNTVHDDNGAWIGDNTDVDGVRAALKSADFNPAGKTIVILGKGGGAKAAVAALQGAKEIITVGRDRLAEAHAYRCDLLINATPVGMHPDADSSPIHGPIAADVVFDMVYNPPITNLLRSAASQGKTIIQGGTMLLAQAARQFEIWTGRPAPAEVFEADAQPKES